MEESITIKTRNLLLFDDEINTIIKSNNVKFLHYYAHREASGLICIIAKKPPPEDMTVSSWYHQIKYHRDHVTVGLPKYLKRYVGKKICCYVERMEPEEDELFRILAIDFILKVDRIKTRNLKINKFPYITSGSEVVMPKFYLNMVLTKEPSRLQLSFNNNIKKSIDAGLLNVNIISRRRRMVGDDTYGLHQIKNGLKTMRVSRFIDFFEKKGKDIKDYKYSTTVQQNGCPYGLIVFEERKDE